MQVFSRYVQVFSRYRRRSLKSIFGTHYIDPLMVDISRPTTASEKAPKLSLFNSLCLILLSFLFHFFDSILLLYGFIFLSPSLAFLSPLFLLHLSFPPKRPLPHTKHLSYLFIKFPQKETDYYTFCSSSIVHPPLPLPPKRVILDTSSLKLIRRL